MGEGFFTIQAVLELIRLDLINVSSANILWVGQTIGAIGALLYCAKLAYEGLLGGSLWSMRVLRPFAIGLLLILYPSFMTAVDGIMMAINNGLGQAFITQDTRITDILKTRDLNPLTDNDDNLIGIEDIQAEEDEQAASIVDSVTESITSTFEVTRWIGEKLYWAMMRLIEEILFRLSHALLMIINTIRVFFLVVLYVVGPLVIGLSAFPGFESAYHKWLGRYLSVHLWLGIGNIYEAIAVRLWEIIVENGGMWTSGVGLEGTANAFILTSWSWVFLLTLIVGYVTIPIVAGWVISGSGIGQAGALLAAAASKGTVKGAAATAKDVQAIRGKDRYRP